MEKYAANLQKRSFVSAMLKKLILNF